MQKKNNVKLKATERNLLLQLISKGKEKARKLTRCRILLLSNEGRSDTGIIDVLGISRNTIRQIRCRYADEGLETAINERSRPGAPNKFSGKELAKITALACSNPPEGRSRWTIRLLGDKAVELDIVHEISHVSIYRTLKKTNLSLT